MEKMKPGGRSWAHVADSFVEYQPTSPSALHGHEPNRFSRTMASNSVESTKEGLNLSEEAQDPQNTRLLIRFLHYRPDLAHAYSTFRRFGRIRSCFLCAKQSKSSIIVDFETKESAFVVKNNYTTYITPEGIETRVKVFWGKRHHQKLPWEWKTPSLSEMITRAQEVHSQQPDTNPHILYVEETRSLDEFDDNKSAYPSVDCTDDWKTLVSPQQPDNRSRQGVGRYPLRLTDPWFEGSELQRNPNLSLGSLLDRSSGSWGSSPSPLALSASQQSVPDDDYRTSSPSSSLASGRSSTSSTMRSTSSSVTSSPRSSAFIFSQWNPGDPIPWDDSDEWSKPSEGYRFMP